MTRCKAFAVIAASLTATSLAVLDVARSGHEIPVYPSYYPHEITIAQVTPKDAAEQLPVGKIHAYIGDGLRLAEPPPESVGGVETLGSFVMVRVNPSSPGAADEPSACAMTGSVIRDLAARSPAFVVHPYPVTPFHGDYLHHVDRAEDAMARILGDNGSRNSAPPGLKVRAGSGIAPSIIRPEWQAGAEWDVEVVVVSAAALVARAETAMNGWIGPPWLKAGWFQAYLLLGGEALAEAQKRSIDEQVRRLESDVFETAAERVNLERSLVADLAANCRARIAGYTTRHVYFSTRFTAGIENIGYDSMTGFNSPIFLRTAKLRDFPWNGWLALGINAAPAAAWNPIAGFTDDVGRLMWSAVGDPAAIPSPYGAGQVFNRVADVEASVQP